MKKLNSLDLKKYFFVGIVDIDRLLKEIKMFSNHISVYRNLLAKSDISNVTLVTSVDEDFNLNIYADFSSSGHMHETNEHIVVEQLKNAMFEFTAEYEQLINKKTAGKDNISVSKDFKRVFHSLIDLRDIENLQVENDIVPIPQIDKTIFRSQTEAYEAPLIGIGTLDFFDYSKRCHLITPEQDGKKRFKQMRVFCDLKLNIELLEARYSDKHLFGEYKVEIVNSDFYLRSFNLIQMDLF